MHFSAQFETNRPRPSSRSAHVTIVVAAAAVWLLQAFTAFSPFGLSAPVNSGLFCAFWLAALVLTRGLVESRRFRPAWARPLRLLSLFGLWLGTVAVALHSWMLSGPESRPIARQDGVEFLVRSVGAVWPIDVVIERRTVVGPLHHDRVLGAYERERVIAILPGPDATVQVTLEEYGRPRRTERLRVRRD